MNFALIINMLLNSSIIASILVILIFIIKRVCKNKISAKWHYIIWFILLLRLAVPYVGHSPLNISHLYNSLIKTENAYVNKNTAQADNALNSPVTMQNSIDVKLQNKAESDNPTNANTKSAETKQRTSINNLLTYLSNSISNIKIDYTIIFFIWIFGIIILSLYAFLYNIYFWVKVKNGTVFTDQSIIKLLEECKEKLGVRTNISIIQTSGISIPAIFGVTRPWLLMPEKILSNLNKERIRYVFFHELAHLKRKDIVVNWITLIFQIIHWFNPFIWLAFYKMRSDREIACDEEVLLHLEQGEEKHYGHTIIDVAEIISGRLNYTGIAGILEDKSLIKDRISRISDSKSRSNKRSILAILILVFLGSSIMVNASDFGKNTTNGDESAATINIDTAPTTIRPETTPNITSSSSNDNTSLKDMKLPALVQVRQPVLSTSGIATWTNVENATSYSVQLYRNDSELVKAQTASSGVTGCDFLSAMRARGVGSYTVRVIAKGDRAAYADSSQSTPSAPQIVSKAETVTSVNLSASGIATWTATNGSSYVMKLYKDTVLIHTQKEAISGYSCMNIIKANGNGSYSITITAKSDSGLIIDGDESQASNLQVIASVSTSQKVNGSESTSPRSEPTFNGKTAMSSVYPGMRGTVEKLNVAVDRVDSSLDDIYVTKIEPLGKLRDGQETDTLIEVEYSLVSLDNATIAICFNNGGGRYETSENAMENCLWEVPKGTGKYRFILPVYAKRWSDGNPFRMLAKLRPTDSGATIYNTDWINLSLE